MRTTGSALPLIIAWRYGALYKLDKFVPEQESLAVIILVIINIVAMWRRYNAGRIAFGLFPSVRRERAINSLRINVYRRYLSDVFFRRSRCARISTQHTNDG